MTRSDSTAITKSSKFIEKPKKRVNQIFATINERGVAQHEHDLLKRTISANRAQIEGNLGTAEYLRKFGDKNLSPNQKIDIVLDRTRKIQDLIDEGAKTTKNIQTGVENYKPPRYERRLSGVEAQRSRALELDRSRFDEGLRRIKKKPGPPTKREDDFFNFGLIKIDKTKLSNDTVSLTLASTGKKPAGALTNKRNISPEFKDVILQLINGEKTVDVRDLNNTDIQYIRNLINRSGLSVNVITDREPIIEKEEPKRNITSSITKTEDTDISSREALKALIQKAKEAEAKEAEEAEIEKVKKELEDVPILEGKGFTKNINRVVHRFDLLAGQIMSGNDSNEVRNELSKVINILVKNRALSVNKAIKITKQLIRNI